MARQRGSAVPPATGSRVAGTAGRDAAVNKRSSVRGAGDRVVRFFRQTVAELRRVVWPNRQQTVTYTAVVLGTVAFLAALIWLTDLVIREAIELVLPG